MIRSREKNVSLSRTGLLWPLVSADPSHNPAFECAYCAPLALVFKWDPSIEYLTNLFSLWQTCLQLQEIDPLDSATVLEYMTHVHYHITVFGVPAKALFCSVSQSAMALEAYAAAANPDKIHTDVLTKARDSCYKARDAFYACLDKESDKKPTEIASVGLLYPVQCKQYRAEFVKQCRSSWVKHFDRQYCQNKRVQRLLDDKESRRGPLTFPQPNTFKPTA
ncbi:hypothetical protein RIF29_07543 [Crotalaria pallida]|uniref:Uncharacterized protein n=1 Tax=Crotalaria pallida TaxID=3830 RepID=A0AAN9PC49_CROPI